MGKKTAKQTKQKSASNDSPIAAPQIKRREEWVKLADEYDGFQFKIWVNAPTRLWSAIEGGGDDAVQALKKIVLEHNGWRDFDGVEYVHPSDDNFVEDIPTELLAIMLIGANEAMMKIPNSMRRKKRR